MVSICLDGQEVDAYAGEPLGENVCTGGGMQGYLAWPEASDLAQIWLLATHSPK